MASQLPKPRGSTPDETVIEWLLASDPAIHWQVMRDLIGAPAEEVAAERARVGTEGWGARLLALQRGDGAWAGVAWNQGWDSTMHVLSLLREFGLDPVSDEARRAVGLVRDHVRWRGWDWDGTWRGWEFEGTPFFAGEVEPCINGQVAASGAYFGQDVERIIDRLLGEQLPDGGWNCEAANGSTRSSFNTTICVLEALLEYELAGGSRAEVREARLRGPTFEATVSRALKLSVQAFQAEDAQAIESALPLYVGELLEGFYEDWVLAERERMRAIYMNALSRLMRYYKQQSAYAESLAYGEMLLRGDPFREDIHREMMRLYVLNGQRPLAVRQYEICRTILASEMDIQPMDETQRLYAQIVAHGTSQLRSKNGNGTSDTSVHEALARLQRAIDTFDEAQHELQQAVRLAEGFAVD
jgi:hypothetical protein